MDELNKRWYQLIAGCSSDALFTRVEKDCFFTMTGPDTWYACNTGVEATPTQCSPIKLSEWMSQGQKPLEMGPDRPLKPQLLEKGTGPLLLDHRGDSVIRRPTHPGRQIVYIPLIDLFTSLMASHVILHVL